MLFYQNLSEFIVGEEEKLRRIKEANIPEVGTIVQVLAPSENQDRVSNPGRHLVTQPVSRLTIDCHGVRGDRHHGLTRPSTGREGALYPRNAKITNRRQIFAVSPHDCHVLSHRIGVEVTPQLLGANIVIGREDDAEFSLSAAPRETYMVIAPPHTIELPKPPIATLVQYVRQRGCSRTGFAISQCYKDPSLNERFVASARYHRGVLCSVEYPVESAAKLEPGQKVFFKFPMGTVD